MLELILEVGSTSSGGVSKRPELIPPLILLLGWILLLRRRWGQPLLRRGHRRR